MDVRLVLAAAACCARSHRSFAQAFGGVWKFCSRGKRANKISSRAAHGGRSLRDCAGCHTWVTPAAQPVRSFPGVWSPTCQNPARSSRYCLFTRARARAGVFERVCARSQAYVRVSARARDDPYPPPPTPSPARCTIPGNYHRWALSIGIRSERQLFLVYDSE